MGDTSASERTAAILAMIRDYVEAAISTHEQEHHGSEGKVPEPETVQSPDDGRESRSDTITQARAQSSERPPNPSDPPSLEEVERAARKLMQVTWREAQEKGTADAPEERLVVLRGLMELVRRLAADRDRWKGERDNNKTALRGMVDDEYQLRSALSRSEQRAREAEARLAEAQRAGGDMIASAIDSEAEATHLRERVEALENVLIAARDTYVHGATGDYRQELVRQMDRALAAPKPDAEPAPTESEPPAPVDESVEAPNPIAIAVRAAFGHGYGIGYAHRDLRHGWIMDAARDQYMTELPAPTSCLISARRATEDELRLAFQRGASVEARFRDWLRTRKEGEG